MATSGILFYRAQGQIRKVTLALHRLQTLEAGVRETILMAFFTDGLNRNRNEETQNDLDDTDK